MEIRRRYTGRHALQTETRTDPDQEWEPSTPLVALGYASPFSGDWEARHALRYGALLGGPVLPFQPLSVRRIRPAERHAVDGAMGYVRRFVPQASELARSLGRSRGQRVAGLLPQAVETTELAISFGNPLTYVPSHTTVTLPPFSGALDFEAQLGFVLGKPLQDATADEALAAIAAFVLVCEFTACDLRLPDSGHGPHHPKQYTSSMAAAAVSAEDLRYSWRDLTGTIAVNGSTVGRPSVEGVPYGLGEIIANASAGEALSAGELFTIGSLPQGSGTALGRRLKAGDELVLELDGLGRIEHPIR